MQAHEPMLKNASNVKSTLNEKHTLVAHHACRWTVAAEEAVEGWIPSTLNLLDVLTKRMVQSQRENLLGGWTC